MLPDKGNGEMDARSRVRRILWGTLRGTLPAARALTMMVRWEADFAPTFERDPAATMTGFLQQELGASLQRAECALLADRILTIMDEFSGTLPQDPIASMRRLSEQRLGVEPGAVAPGAVAAEPVATGPVATGPVAADPTPDDDEAGLTEATAAPEPLPVTMQSEPVGAAVIDDPESVDDRLDVMPDSWTGDAADDAAAWRGSAILPADRYFDRDRDERIERRADMADVPAYGSERLFDQDVEPEQEVDHFPAPRGFERARTLDILAPIDHAEAYRLDPVEIEAEAEPDSAGFAPLDMDIPQAPFDSLAAERLEPQILAPETLAPETLAPEDGLPVRNAADPSARYGIDRSVFSKIFLEHD